MGLFGKSKRVRLGEAVRATCRPLLYELGFRNPRKRDPDRWHGTRLDVFIRWRDSDFDEVVFDWARWHRPSFRLSFMSSKFERDSDGRRTEYRWWTSGAVCVWQPPEGSFYFENFGPWRSPKRAAELACRGLLDLNDFFLRGVAGRHVNLGKTVRLGPGLDPPELNPWWRRFGDPALDPESDQPPKMVKKQQ